MRILAPCIVFLLSLNQVQADSILLRDESEGMAFRVEQVAGGLGIPWGMAWIDDRHLIITERGGNLFRVHRDSGKRETLQGVPQVFASGQGGLLDVARAPGDLGKAGWFYFTYSKEIDGQGATTLARARLDGGRMQEWQELMVTRSRTDTGRHYGSRITFDAKGHVFFGVGDRGERPNGQRLDTHAGSVMRLGLDGTVPSDNPFVGRSNALPEIWSYGHRNPQGLVYDQATDRLWLIEHGPRGGDEINWVKKGLNYGWPVISYGKEYWGPLMVGEATAKPGMEQPVKYYTPSIAPGSLLVYRGAAFPKWQGNLLAGALKLTHLNRVVLSDAGEFVREERLLEDLNERIRALLPSPEGWLYLSTDSGRLLVLKPDESKR